MPSSAPPVPLVLLLAATEGDRVVSSLPSRRSRSRSGSTRLSSSSSSSMTSIRSSVNSDVAGFFFFFFFLLLYRPFGLADLFSLAASEMDIDLPHSQVTTPAPAAAAGPSSPPPLPLPPPPRPAGVRPSPDNVVISLVAPVTTTVGTTTSGLKWEPAADDCGACVKASSRPPAAAAVRSVRGSLRVGVSDRDGTGLDGPLSPFFQLEYAAEFTLTANTDNAQKASLSLSMYFRRASERPDSSLLFFFFFGRCR